MEETLVVTGLRTNLTDTWRNSGNARRRQGPACVHRVEDGVKKHRLTAASSSLRVSRHVTLRKVPSSSVEVPTCAYQPRGRDVPARAIRSRGCQCALYFCIRRSPCLRTGPSYHQRAARAILEGFSCTHDSAGARMLIGTRNACTFAPSVAPSARMTFLHDRLVRSGQRGAGNILELLQMPRQYSTRIFSCMLAPFVAPSARMT